GSVTCTPNPSIYNGGVSGTDRVVCVADGVSDPEGEAVEDLRFEWVLPAGSTGMQGCQTANGNLDCAFTRSEPGSTQVTVKVTDPYGQTTERIGTAVFVNQPPQVNITCTSNQSGALRTNKVGDPTITCQAQVQSPDMSQNFIYNWQAS